jgi:pimeloyl-ACP methyl ester carboxylesterase
LGKLPDTRNAGFFRSGLPFNKSGHGPRVLVVFQGLQWENKPLDRLSVFFVNRIYRFFKEDYTIYVVTRRPGLPQGFSMKDMSDDYAGMIKEEFGGPIDIIGTSTGGSIALHFAADHPDLVRHLVIHSAAHTLGERAKKSQMDTAHLARRGKWRAAFAEMLGFAVSPSWYAPLLIWIGSSLMSLSAPKDPSDFIITIEAEDDHNFKERLSKIISPTLVVAGAEDLCYPEKIVRETAEGIPNSQLILYEGMGHIAGGKQFGKDVLSFLREEIMKD